MGEVDYQLALLLQHQFEQEFKNNRECSSDLELAKTLQEQFQKEFDIEKPIKNLVYDKKQFKNTSKSLTDPSWEVVDPTPDIHVLFMAFNERFFWNKLLAVCVSWSKRMTSCAGICSYQGRGGLCSITLSEPLLKLRPRKDLVETLLHEMIHAYLFVTHNNKDREGHGPEFHKHMYRINGAAGTNITVYHDFHDEVRLYQQHWWRCDGPCQNRKPYFGMIRRSVNRAPGPQDRWWGEHSRSCGGMFIKVKEPEKPPKKETKSSVITEMKKPKEDIRKFISSTKVTSPVNTTIASNKKDDNIHGVLNTGSSAKIGTVILSKASNIFGFTNLKGTPSSGSLKSKGVLKGAVRNNSNTIVISKTQNGSMTSASSSKSDLPVKTDSCTNSIPERILSDGINHNGNTDYSVVRNHWLNKYAKSSTSDTVKRGLSEDSNQKENKIPKLSSYTLSPTTSQKSEEAKIAKCPVCTKEVLLIQLNAHLDKCLQSHKDSKECVTCSRTILIIDYEKHAIECSKKSNTEDENPQDFTKCTFCETNIPTKSYNNHLVTCLREFDLTKDDVIDLTCDKPEKKQCAICDKNISIADYDAHAEKCLLKMYSDMESTYSNKEESVDCLACGKKIIKSELGLHLEDCMSLSGVFDDNNEPKEGEASKGCNNEDNKYNCPFCMELVSEIQMSSHIDYCLNIKEVFNE